MLTTTSGHWTTWMVIVGPILLGTAKPVHIMTPASTVRRIVNMSALAAADLAKL